MATLPLKFNSHIEFALELITLDLTQHAEFYKTIKLAGDKTNALRCLIELLGPCSYHAFLIDGIFGSEHPA